MQWNHRIYVPKIESPVKTRQMLILCVTKQRLVSFNRHRHRYPFDTRVCFLVCTRFVPTYLGSRRMKVRLHRSLGERSVRGVRARGVRVRSAGISTMCLISTQLSRITPSLITYSFAIIPFEYEHSTRASRSNTTGTDEKHPSINVNLVPWTEPHFESQQENRWQSRGVAWVPGQIAVVEPEPTTLSTSAMPEYVFFFSLVLRTRFQLKQKFKK